MLLFRKLLFFIFTAVYIIACPILILYSLGYVYNPVRQKLVRTGIVSLSTLPRDALVFLEKSRFIHRTPADIRELLPGNYTIKLKKKGYKPWTHLLSVEAGKVVAFENILLVPDKWPVKNMAEQSCKTLLPLENKQHLFLVSTGANLSSFFIYDKDETLRPLLNPESPFAAVSVNKIYLMPKSDTLILSAGSFWDKKTLHLNLAKKPPAIKDITEIFGGKPSFVTSHGADADQIYTLQDNCVNHADVKAKQFFPCEWNKLKGFGLYGKWIYIIDPNGVLLRESSESKKQEILSEDTALSRNLFDRSHFYHITIKENGIIVFLGTEGDFIANVPPYNIASQDISGFSFNSDENLLLCWSKNSVSIVDFSGKSGKTLFQEKFTVRTVHENARNIKQCCWAYKNSHILCNDAGDIYLIEIEPQGSNHVEHVCKVQKDTDIFYDSDKHALYYLDEKTGMLEKLQVVPE